LEFDWNAVRVILSALTAGTLVPLISYLFWKVYRHPEIFEKWLALSRNRRRYLCYWLRHRKTKREYNSITDSLKKMSKEADADWPNEIVVEFVSPEEYGRDYVKGERENGTIRIVRAWDSDVARMYYSIVQAFFRDGTFPRLQNIVKPEYIEGLTLALTLRALDSASKKSAFFCFLDEVVKPLLRKDSNDRTRKYFRQFKELDGAGLLTSVLARELSYIDKMALHVTNPGIVDDEAESVLLFLDTIRQKRKNQKAQLSFEGSIIRFGVMPVGNPLTRTLGETPYLNRIRKRLSEGFPRIYLWAVGESNVQLVDKVAAYRFEGTVTAKVKKEYYTSRFSTLPCTVVQITLR